MKLSNAYPYPVLFSGNDDYTHTSFQAKINVEESFGDLKVHVSFSLDNDEILHYVRSDRAVFMIHIECPQTSFRNAYHTTKNELTVSIPINQVRGKMTIHSFIVANDRIEQYTNSALNEWYKEVPITFEKGNFIGIDQALEVMMLEENLEQLNLPSVVSINKSKTTDIMEVDLSDSNIHIILPEKEYEYYATIANSRLKQTILSLVMTPCLTYVFSEIADNSDDYDDKLWYQVLKKLFEENGYKIEDVGTDKLPSLKAAQLLLRKPIKAGFEEIMKLQSMED